jgi:hypothetical protein
MLDHIRLGPLEAVAGRQFAAPEHSLADLAVLEAMRERLRQVLGAPGSAAGNPDRAEIHVQYVHEEHNRLHRVVLIDRTALRSSGELAFVGFFGHRRGDANPALLQDIDTELIQEFLHHRYVLSYSSCELPDGNWANLVILQHIDGIQHWRASQKHAYAARELAPQYYTGIRLHNGALPAGLDSPHMELTTTKYYDFGSGELWHAIREERIGHD